MLSVSVIIPCYNQAEYLSEAIESALAQQGMTVELIVVDDGSTDDTAKVLQRYTMDVKYVRRENGGQASARNEGIAQCNGEVVAFLDADDRWMPDKLVRQLPLFDDPHVGLVFGGYRQIDRNGCPLSADLMPEADVDVHALITSNRVGVLTAVARRSALEEVGRFGLGIDGCEDWDLWIRIAARYELRAVPAVLAEYRVHGTNVSGRPHRMFRARMKVLERNGRTHPGCNECRRAVTAGHKEARRQYLEELRRTRARLRSNGDSRLKVALATMPHDALTYIEWLEARVRYHLQQ